MENFYGATGRAWGAGLRRGGQLRMMARTSSRLASISALVLASRFRRTRGSVLERRTLNHQVGYSKLRPSSSILSASAYLLRSLSNTSRESATVELISPLAK